MNRYLFLSIAMLASATTMTAQDDMAARRHVKAGNKQFNKHNLSEAETSYRKALEKNKENPQALYNLGTTLLQQGQAQGQDTLAIKFLEDAARAEKNPLRQSKAFHNLGVILQGRKMYAEAIEQYKQALRLNPADDDARYNLAVCKHQLKNQPQDQNQDNQDKKNNQDQQQKQDQQKQDQQKQDQQKQQQQEQKPQMSKENAEQLLNAAMQQEKQTQERMKEAQRQPQRRQVEKNW